MAGTGREIGYSGGGGTGPRVAGPVRPTGERVAGRGVVRGVGPLAGAPPARRDGVRPGARPVRLEGGAVRPGRVRGGVATRRAGGGAPLRLTRRGWCALTALAVAVAALAVLVLSAVLAPEGELELAGVSSVVVQPGDTVWSIAASVAGPEADVRTVVDAIERLNDLEGATIVPGQVLEVP
ncbi:LysM peptidoglycan-binding domain-containing protein [Trujillonella endophytica]|uniref:LysM domain-containing protein n=1 Tax=Trujillonella endophytica TaxID=673521 RepID=A0A1H8VHK1_9ACTN|nr:LysM peptidoglycan-binding domain-containing protein [Trujillella endophytica]SEP14901.1 LysM domain-containing protein [Trujillella endophytica]